MGKKYNEIRKRLLCLSLAILMATGGVAEPVYAKPMAQIRENEPAEEITGDEIQENDLAEEEASVSGNEYQEVEEEAFLHTTKGEEEIIIDLDDPSQIPNYGYHEIEENKEVESIYAVPKDGTMWVDKGITLPDKYVNDNLPNTRAQGGYGTCWAHSALAVAEANLMKQKLLGEGQIDTSELHLSYFTYHTTQDPLGGITEDIRAIGLDGENYLDRGGNIEQATRTLFAWMGTAAEATAPYSYCDYAYSEGLSHDIAFQDVAHIKNAYVVNTASEREEAKRLIYEYGAISTSYFAVQSGSGVQVGGEVYTFSQLYNSANNAYYFPVSTGTNHAVTIVGWDDNFSKENFSIQPEGDGAWLIRNSWTTYNGNNYYGYFWMSYYDKSMRSTSYAYEMDTANNYDNNYQYDGTYFSISSYADTCANVYEVKAGRLGESLEAVSFETEYTNLEYTIEIYTKVAEGGDPYTGVLTLSCSGTTKYAGYHTVELPNPVTLNYGERFAVVVKVAKAGYTVGINYEYTYQNQYFNTVANIKKGESFYYSYGNWYDRYNEGNNATGNFCIKAYTKNFEERVEANDILISETLQEGLILGVEEEFQIYAKVLPNNALDTTITFQSSDDTVVTVTESGKLLGIKKGTAVITVTTSNGIKKQFTVNVVEKINKITINGKQSLYVGEQCTYDISWEPTFVTPNGSVFWSSDNTGVLTIDARTGEATAVGVGSATLYAQLDGVSASMVVNVNLDSYSSEFQGEADNNSIVTLSWKPVLGATKYELKRGSTLLQTYQADGRENYTFTDAFYQGTQENQEVYYILVVSNGQAKYDIYAYINVGPCKTITYVIPHGINHELNPYQYRTGDNISLYAPIIDPGYYFEGWYYDSEYTNRVYHLGYFSTEDITIYAKVLPIQYTIILYSNSYYNESNYISAEYDQEFILSKEAFLWEGYELTGWNTKADGSGLSYEIDKPVKNLTTTKYGIVYLYAQWEKSGYKVSLDANGGTVGKDYITAAYRDTYGMLPIAEREGYQFLGWFTKPTGGKQVVATDLYPYEYASTLYAQWERNAYTVTFNPGEGRIPLEESTKTVYAELEYDTLPQPTRIGYSFKGWFFIQGEKKTEINEDSIVTVFEDHELVAEWEELPPVYANITYILSHGVNHQENPMQYQLGKQLLLKEAIPEAGYLFEGWYRDFEYNNLTEGIKNTDEMNLVFYAKMTPVTYQIVYCSNNGKEDETEESVKYEQTVALPNHLFQRAGYLFQGWNTKADGTGVFYEAGKDVKNLTTVLGDKIYLYAQWKEIPEEFEGFLIEGLLSEYTYTGKAIKPEVRVYHGRKLLTEKKDYSISYKNNTNANDASDAKKAPTIVVTGKGDYIGKVTDTFVIKPKSIAGEDIVIPNIVKKYNNKLQKVIPTVKDQRKTLKNKTHYTLEYPDLTEENPMAYQAASEIPYTVLVHGKGNYCGTNQVSLQITDKTMMNQISISSIKAQIYTGSPIEPKVVVKYKKQILEEGIDYAVTYANNTDIGTAKVIVTGEGKYIGTKEIGFKIIGVPINKAKVTGIPASIVYTGQELKIKEAGWQTEPKLTVKVNGEEKSLSENDYTVSYLKNTVKGTGTIIFKGINSYSGELKKNFKITAYNIGTDSEKKITISLPEEIYYEKGGTKPKPMVKFGDMLLQEGKDYTLSYKNNNTVYNGCDFSKVPTVIVKGKGNFTGTKTESFKILQKDISGLEMVINDKVYQNKKNSYKSTPKIIDINNKTLGKKVDYFDTVIYQYKDDTSLEDGTLRAAGTIVDSMDIVPMNTTIKVIVEGRGNYWGTIEGEYKLSELDINKAKVTVKPQIYTGKEVEPGYEEIQVTYDGEFLDSSNYEIVNYSNNVKKGSASLTIRGKGKFAGTKTVKFVIKSKEIVQWSDL